MPTSALHLARGVQVGSNPNMIGMPGIAENCQPLKTLEGASRRLLPRQKQCNTTSVQSLTHRPYFPSQMPKTSTRSSSTSSRWPPPPGALAARPACPGKRNIPAWEAVLRIAPSPHFHPVAAPRPVPPLPRTSPDEIAKLLSLVVVGGGPTGLEISAQLYDQAEALRAKLMPTLSPDVVRVTLVELRDSVLSGVDKDIAAFAARRFSRSNVNALLNARVMQADPNLLTLVNLSAQGDDVLQLPFGLCVWCTGLSMNPLVRQIASQLQLTAPQRHSRALVVDGLLRVKGTKPGTMFALGDAAWVDPAVRVAPRSTLAQNATSCCCCRRALRRLSPPSRRRCRRQAARCRRCRQPQWSREIRCAR